ncbi:MAG: TadE/TadG family type IV pilus assembly protein [Pseudomonadota bacterium]
MFVKSCVNAVVKRCVRSNLARDDGGAVTPLMAAGFVTALTALGGGIDISRTYLAQTRLQVAVDAATLAGARTMRLDTGSSDSLEAGSDAWNAIQEYFAANFPEGYAGAELKPLEITGSRNGSDVDVDIIAEGVVPATFARLAGIQDFDISARSSAKTSRQLDARPAEVMLVLDNTGSMASNNRIGKMKTAVGEFLDVVYGDKEEQSDIAIGVIPYNTVVNVGYAFPENIRFNYIRRMPHFTHDSSGNPYQKNNHIPLAWKGCVQADHTIQNVSGNADNLDGSEINVIDNHAWDIGLSLPGQNGRPSHGSSLIHPFYYPPIKVDSFQTRDNRFRIHNNINTANDMINHPSYDNVYHYMEEHYNQNIDTFGLDEKDKNGADGADGYADITNENASKVTKWGNRPIDGRPRYNKHFDDRIDLSVIPDYNNSSKFKNAKNYDFRPNVNNRSINGPSPNYQCPSPAKKISYSHKKSDLLSYVNNENAALNPGLGTYHNNAMTWAYRLLEQDAIFTRDVPGTVAAKRYLVFMTDGNFDYRDDGHIDPNGVFRRDTALTSYGTARERRLVNSESKSAIVDALILRFAKTCQAAKRDGIEVYTIAFDLNNSTQGSKTRKMFRKCATNENTHFFDAATGSELSFAYRSIASDLTELHLSR